MIQRRMMMLMQPRSIRITSFSKMPLKLLSIKWQKTRVMNQVRKFLMVSMSLPIHPSIENCWKPCLTIIENYSVQRTSNKYWNKRQDNEVYLFHKFYHQRKRNYMKKPKRWLINTVGLFSLTLRLVLRMMVMFTVSCSLNLPSYQIKRQTGTFTRQ